MKIQFIQALVGTDVNQQPGSVAEWPEVEARRLIDAGIAVPVEFQIDEVNESETATLVVGQSARVKVKRYTRGQE
jgi:hypothetical protein